MLSSWVWSPDMEYRLSEAGEGDVPWLDELRRRAYEALFLATWGSWDESRHRRHFAASLEGGPISIIHVDGERVGMIQVTDHPDALEIGEVQIDPDHQGRGIGTAVLRDLIRRACGQDRSVRLRVGLENEGAIRLYRRLGFEEVGRTETHRLLRFASGREGPTPGGGA